MNSLAPFALFASLAVAGGIIGGIGRFLLGSLDSAAKNRRCPVQFTLADFLAIFVLLQVLLGCVHYFANLSEQRWVYAEAVADIIAASFVAALWWTTVRTLSKAGIHKVRTRLLMLLVVIPASYFIALTSFLPAIWLCAIAFRWSELGGWTFLALAAQVSSIVAMFLLRRTVLSVLAAAGQARIDVEQ